LDFKPEEAVICITGDHSTPCSVKDHSGDPVPILFNTSGILGNHVRFFDEVSCLKTGLNLRGLDVMPYLLQLSDRAEKYGA
jgi:2,3-bisphosphoglycerate-independent phosphoglycerate mutase